ncbi:putative ankyrin repeat protein [Chloropicon roscoffensis]|uniref:Ankyrin repeat protein n=1 Tax=Chloropicon roscoffensis TaxID=1461544 RepID=A0AAX4PIV1_9CHLO
MVEQKKRRREGTDTEPALVKALRQEVEGLKLRNPKIEAESQTPQEKEKEVKLPTRAWAIIAGKIHPNDVCSFALVSKQLREAQVLAGRELVTRLTCRYGAYDVKFFTEDWCAYWSRKFNVHHTDRQIVKAVLFVAARHGYLQVFEKYWSQAYRECLLLKKPQKKLSKLWDKDTCRLAAEGGHFEVIKWLRAKGCQWDVETSNNAARGGHLEMLQWLQAQDPPCPWTSGVCDYAACEGHLEVLRWARSQGCPWDDSVTYAAAGGGHLEVLRWARSQGCPWDERVTYAAARGGHLEVLRWARGQGCPWNEDVPWAAAMFGHLEVLKWLIKEGCPYSKRKCREAAARGGQRARKVLEWLNE